MSPNKMRKKEYQVKARMNVAMKAKKKTIPRTARGDKREIMRKKRITASHWLQEEYTVQEITQKSWGKYISS